LRQDRQTDRNEEKTRGMKKKRSRNGEIESNQLSRGFPTEESGENPPSSLLFVPAYVFYIGLAAPHRFHFNLPFDSLETDGAIACKICSMHAC